jgi:hypothetical protein
MMIDFFVNLYSYRLKFLLTRARRVISIYFVAAGLFLFMFVLSVLFLVEIVAVGVVFRQLSAPLFHFEATYYAGSIDFSLSHTFIKSRTKAVSRHIITRNPQRSMLNTLSI